MNYYESKDVGRFAEVGKFAPKLMEKFFAYYNEAVGSEGALTKREKALIALAFDAADDNEMTFFLRYRLLRVS